LDLERYQKKVLGLAIMTDQQLDRLVDGLVKLIKKGYKVEVINPTTIKIEWKLNG